MTPILGDRRHDALQAKIGIALGFNGTSVIWISTPQLVPVFPKVLQN